MFAALAAGPAAAPAQVQQFKAKDTVVVNPQLSYVVVRTGLATDLRLHRLVDADDIQRWEQARQAAFEKARQKYENQLKRYEREIEYWNSSDRAKRDLRVKPVKPDEVTIDTLPIAPVQMANFEVIFRGRQLAEDSNKVRTFLVALKPGTYVIYGAVGLAPGVGSCYCMGTIAFEAPAGQVVDAGSLLPRGDWYAPADYMPPSAAPSVPAQLAGSNVVPAKIRAAGKMANFFGAPVTRLNPVPGVLGYQRDVPLDLAAGGTPIPAIR